VAIHEADLISYEILLGSRVIEIRVIVIRVKERICNWI
jgi:hypothetical protein